MGLSKKDLKDMAPSGASLLRRYAQECRTLAYECAEGIAPPFITDSFEEPHGRCALGWVLHRIDPTASAWDTFWHIYNVLVGMGTTPCPPRERTNAPDSAVIDANNKTTEQERHGAVVFPLLWLADAISALCR